MRPEEKTGFFAGMNALDLFALVCKGPGAGSVEEEMAWLKEALAELEVQGQRINGASIDHVIGRWWSVGRDACVEILCHSETGVLLEGMYGRHWAEARMVDGVVGDIEDGVWERMFATLRSRGGVSWGDSADLLDALREASAPRFSAMMDRVGGAVYVVAWWKKRHGGWGESGRGWRYFEERAREIGAEPLLIDALLEEHPEASLEQLIACGKGLVRSGW